VRPDQFGRFQHSLKGLAMRARTRATKAITIIAAAGAVGLTMAGAPARAQGVTTAISAVQQCLCAQREVSIQAREMSRARQNWERLHSEAEAMSRQVEETRPRVNTDDRGDIEAFKALLARRDAAARSYRQGNQEYAAAVARYNDAVEQNNAACSGRLFDPEQVEAVRANLACPRY
jgi:hypothetical protein